MTFSQASTVLFTSKVWYYTGVNINFKYMPKANSAFMKPMNVSPELEAVVGKGPMPRSEVVKAIWVYIKKNNLQDAADKRIIVADETLKKVFGGQEKVHMMKMAGLLAKHLS